MQTEVETRQQLIDRQLAQAGWSQEQRSLVEEFLLPRAPEQAFEARRRYQAGDGLADYVLLGADGKPLGVVEAKRFTREALSGQRQAAEYADRIKATTGKDPFIFLTNGQEVWFWDRERAAARQVPAFFTREDLERYTFQRQYRQPLESVAPQTRIVEREYQHEAIRRVTEGMTLGQRKFLLVMATGTGKTRTIIALVDLLMRARWVQRVLFLADRRELVRQALGEFKVFLPNEARSRIESGAVDDGARLHVATYPSMMQVYQQLSAGYYDLIIADESHRSIYNRYRDLFTHFDALQLGLTATPTEEIDHNTFELFACPNDIPTFHYAYETAVVEKHLVDYRVLEANTRFQLQGIKAGQLPEEVRRQMSEQGVELSEINFEGSDLERRVTNSGTNDALVQEFMDKCRQAEDGLPAKTIIFAISHAHAKELWKSFGRLYPDLQRRGLAEIIDSHMEQNEKALDDFKRRSMPRVAISVDMLDTGIDVPAIQNLVFAKPVFSKVKFRQMIGRGTRLWSDPLTGKQKTEFLIIDHWNNFRYHDLNPEGETKGPTVPLPARLFRERVETLARLRGQSEGEAAETKVIQLQAMLAGLPPDNVNLRPHLEAVQELEQASGWEDLGPERRAFLSETVAPLLRFTEGINPIVQTFELRVVRLTNAFLSGDVTGIEAERGPIVEDLSRLPGALPEVAEHEETLAWVTSEGFWAHLDYVRTVILESLAPLLRFRPSAKTEMIMLNLPDQIMQRRWILYGPTGEGAFADSYREQVEAYVRDLASRLPALIALQRGETPTESDLEELSRALNTADLFVTEDVLRQVYERPEADLTAFLKHILGQQPLRSRADDIRTAFDRFLKEHPQFTATQLNFLRTVRSAVLRGASLTEASLTQPPFSRVGAVDVLFTAAERAALLGLTQGLEA